ncbi:coiled-coil domain-containing protein 122-like isoform X2 [Oscarella lobularis]|uniref:coiled-coil domain-containing protein 122-like isoform X2 n=1 Tax=Oscarella lobularis TaxID=121494 RepID=UPI0033132634
MDSTAMNDDDVMVIDKTKGGNGSDCARVIDDVIVPAEGKNSTNKIADELESVHDEQETELQQKKKTLAQLEVDIEEEEKRRGLAFLRLAQHRESEASIRRHLTELSFEEETKQKELRKLLRAKSDSKAKLHREEVLEKEEARKFENYHQKMKEHHRRVIGYEKSCPLELEIERLEATILSLTDEKSKFSEFDEDKDIAMQANLIELQARKADLLLEVKSREDAVREPLRQYRVSSSLLTNQQRQLKDQEDKLKFRIEMLHRRNQAQKTRLRRQIEDRKARIAYWQNEAFQLQAAIEEIKRVN